MHAYAYVSVSPRFSWN